MRILYDSKLSAYKTPFGVLRENEECSISIDIPLSCKTRCVKLELFTENGGSYAAFSLNKTDCPLENYEKWAGKFCLKEAGLYFYRFYIVTEESEFPLYREGYDKTNMCAGEYWQLSCIPLDFHTPKDFAGKVMYQIFPDRFYKAGDCDLSSKLEPYWVHKSTDELPDFRPDKKGEVLNCDFFGGNLKGISKKLGYLKRLGVSVIYLNPIFKAYSNHRYDTADYKKIDEMLGCEADFKNLCKKAHKLSIKIILDGVFSHTGSRSVYFEDAVSNPDSPYREWFDFKNYPHDYTSWWGIKTLPCTNEMNEKFREFIIGGEDSVIAHWLKAGADGFRLDVADELPDEFIKELRERMKKIKPDSLLIGEVWEDASNKISYGKRRKYFTNGELDSVMNYPFRNAIIDFVTGKDNGINLERTVMTIAENYPSEVTSCLMNSLSTHDTPRILSLLSGAVPPENKEERAVFKLSDEQLRLAEQRLKCAAFLQFVLPGMPCIYYGDEIGTQGFEDPFCRTFFDWQRAEDSQLKKYYERLAAMRNKLQKVFAFGDIRFPAGAELRPSLVMFSYYYNEKSYDVMVNCKDSPHYCRVQKRVGKKIFAPKLIFAENAKQNGEEFIIEPYGAVLFEL